MSLQRASIFIYPIPKVSQSSPSPNPHRAISLGNGSDRLTQPAHPRRLLDIPDNIRARVLDTGVTDPSLRASARSTDQAAYADRRSPGSGCFDPARQETARGAGEDERG